MGECVLKVEDVIKQFPGTLALNKAKIEVAAGECVGLVGENGAGKSTMMNIISGSLQPDGGKIIFMGKEVRYKNPRESMLAGIGFVHQELALCQHLSAAENLFMGRVEHFAGSMIDWKKIFSRADQMLARFKADFSSSRRVSTLSVAQQQIIEITKALSMDAKVIIFDEPTSSLTTKETIVLFDIIKQLKKEGIAVIYISHRMAEIFEVCDRVTIMRDGEYITSLNIQETCEQEIISNMVGREISELYPEKNALPLDKEVLRVENLSGKGFKDIFFSIRKGEIIGFSGLIGAGRSEVARAICGIDKYTKGSIYLNGEKIVPDNYKFMIDRHICYLSEDRKKDGLFLKMSVEKNICVSVLDQISKHGFLNSTLESQVASKQVTDLCIKVATTKQSMRSLSGGNQQKAMVGKWLAAMPDILFMDEPTRGIDVGAKSEIHNLLRELSNCGVNIILISSELPEIIGLSDRVIVMHEGKKTAEFFGDDITEENIMTAASGLVN
ncbi:MAG: sugar ABC transporter ATP-binding protein [Christensenellales bacterium]|jgi:ribose transport system ATP-binding protein